MATVQNYKDNALQGATVRFDATLTEVDWVDVVDNYALKPENNATVGAEFDVNIVGTADTHNITQRAVSEYDFAETSTYIPATETMGVDVTVVPKTGDVILFVSLFFRSSYSATSGYSEATVTITHDAVTVFTGVVCRVPNETGSQPIELILSEKTMNTPDPTPTTSRLVTYGGDYLVTYAGDNLAAAVAGDGPETFTVEATFDATGDGTRGEIAHLAVYALVLKR